MKGKELLLIIISSFILTVVWVASNVYHAYATSTIEPYLQLQITPIDPSFDMQTVDALRSRVQIEPDFQSSAPVITPPETTPGSEPADVPEEAPIPSDVDLEPTPSQVEETPEITEEPTPTQAP